MTEIYFINEKDLRAGALLNDNVESGYIKQAIRDAQDIDLQQIIGSSLYNSLKKQVQEGAMKSEEYIILMNEYIQPYLLNDIMATITIPLHYKFRNSGIVTNNDQHYSSAQLNEVTYVEQHYKNLANFNANRIIEYIMANKDVFTEIENNDNWLKITDQKTKSPIYFRK